MTAVNRIFIAFLAFIVILAASLGAFLFISLLPYFTFVGMVTVGLVIVAILCCACLMLSFTFNQIGSWTAKRKAIQLNARMLVGGDVVVYVNPDGSFAHWSAMHESAKAYVESQLQKQLPAPRQEEQEEDGLTMSKEDILDLYSKGTSIRTIADSTGMTYYQVQKITSAAEMTPAPKTTAKKKSKKEETKEAVDK